MRLFYLALTFSSLAFADLAALQKAWSAQRCGAMIAFNMSSFVPGNGGWATPNIDPNTFAPTGLNIDQWLDTVVAAGCKYANLTAKHHDGFALWPTAVHATGFAPYSIAQTTWYANNGSPDIVGLFVTKCRQRGLNPVIYFSIWDRTYEIRQNITAASDPTTYISMIEAQLSELLAYGPLTAIWTDGWGWSFTPTTPGAVGGVGGYAYIPFATLYNYLKAIAPNTLWIENDHAHPTPRSDIEVYELTGGDTWTDNLRPSDIATQIPWSLDWFYDSIKATNYAFDSPANVFSSRKISEDMRLYARTNAAYTLALTVDQTGNVPAVEVAAWTGWMREQVIGTNLAAGKTATVSSTLSGFGTAANLTDGLYTYTSNNNTLWLSNTGDQFPWAEVDLASEQTIARVEVFNMVRTGTGGYTRDLVFTIYDNSHTLVYTSAAINPLNVLSDGGYARGPGQINLDIPGGVTGRYVRVTRNGTATTSQGCQLHLHEIKVFGLPKAIGTGFTGSAAASGGASIQ